MTYHAWIVVAEGDTPDEAWEKLNDGHLVDTTSFVSDAWIVAPIVIPIGRNLARDGFIPSFDVETCIDQHPSVTT